VRAFVQALNAGTPGDARAGLRVFKGRPARQPRAELRAEFAKALEGAARASGRPCRTRDGWRAMRLDAVTAAQAGLFEALRGVVLQDWTDATASEQRTAGRPRAGQEVQGQARGRRRGDRMNAPSMRPCLLLAAASPWRRCFPAPARAHEMSMAEMEVRETSPGEFFWQWSAQSDKRPMGRT
jgi:hypothetical protein